MVTIKTKNEIDRLREGGKILANVKDKLIKKVKPGITTGQLEQFASELIKAAGGRPSFKGYKSRHDIKPFPTALCTSINHEVVHAPALPSRRLETGDILSLDIGMEYPFNAKTRGLYTDIAATVPVGKTNRDAKRLIRVTAEALALGIKQVKPGHTLNDIGRAIEAHVVKHRFKVVKDLVGHGVGYEVHEDPHVPNYAIDDQEFSKFILKPGMVLAIEPMVNIGTEKVVGSPDGFTIKTADGSLSAHFEHTVAVTERGCVILTNI